jgi:hypothetical protein
MQLLIGSSVVMVGQPSVLAETVLDNRPTIALSASSGQHGQLAESLYNMVLGSLSGLNRFEIVDRPRLDALVVERGKTSHGRELPGSPSKLSLQFDYGIDFVTKNQETYTDTQGKSTVYYTESWQGYLKVVNVATGTIYKHLKIDSSGTATDGFINAHTAARNGFIHRMTEQVKESFKVEAQVIGRTDRVIKMNVGSDSGVRENDVFEVIRYGLPTLDPTSGEVLGVETDTIGKVLVSRTFPRYSEAYIVRGTYKLKVKDQLREAPRQGNVSLAVVGATEVVSVSYSDGKSNATTTLALMPQLVLTLTALLPQSGIEIGPALSVGTLGFGSAANSLIGDAGIMTSYPLVPEMISFYGVGGVGGWGITGSAGSNYLNLFGGLGLRAHVIGGLAAFGEARYRQRGGSAASNYSWGGMSIQSGLSYTF